MPITISSKFKNNPTMESSQYLKMLLEGIINHPDYLPEYLNRRQLQAEEEFIGFHEFMDRMIGTIEFLEGELRNAMKDKNQKLNLCKNGRNNEETDKIIKGISIWDVTINLSTYTNNEFQGSLTLDHVSSIRFGINNAFEFTIEEREGARYELIERKVNKKIKIKEEPGKSALLHDFFIQDTSPDIIKLIQNEFKNYVGKKMAVLISVLERDLKLITYFPNSKTHGRKHFVLVFTNSGNVKMQGINKYFDSNGDLKVDSRDSDLLNIKEKLSIII